MGEQGSYRRKSGHNLYGFVWNDGINYSDFLGLVLYAFDGTWANQSTWTNVSMLAGSYLGTVYYEPGLGSKFYSKHLGGAMGAGASLKLENMYKRLVKNYERDQFIDIIGFSRGAALAREFANMIYNRGIVETRTKYANISEGANEWQREVVRTIDCQPKIRFLGLFDTVESFWLPYIDLFKIYEMAVPPNVGHAAHAVAGDEFRREFRFTPLYRVGDEGSKVIIPYPGQHFRQEIFPGDHSDIGGGHEADQNFLAIAPLRFMHREGLNAGVPFGAVPFDTRPWPYKDNFNAHDMRNSSLLFTNGGRRSNLISFDF